MGNAEFLNQILFKTKNLNSALMGEIVFDFGKKNSIQIFDYSQPNTSAIAGNIDGSWIKDETIDAKFKIAQNTIDSARIELGAITSELIALGAITETKISDDAISTPKLQANSIVSSKIATAAITAIHLITDQAVITGSAQIQDAIIIDAKILNLSGSKITANSITASKMNVTTLSSITADLGSITAGSVLVGDAYNKLWLNRDFVITIGRTLVFFFSDTYGVIGKSTFNPLTTINDYRTQSFVISETTSIYSIKIIYLTQGTPSDGLECKIFNNYYAPAGVEILHTSTSTVVSDLGVSIGGIPLKIAEFKFTAASLSAGTYIFGVHRTGANSDTNYYQIAETSDFYSNGAKGGLNEGYVSFGPLTGDLEFEIVGYIQTGGGELAIGGDEKIKAPFLVKPTGDVYMQRLFMSSITEPGMEQGLIYRDIVNSNLWGYFSNDATRQQVSMSRMNYAGTCLSKTGSGTEVISSLKFKPRKISISGTVIINAGNYVSWFDGEADNSFATAGAGRSVDLTFSTGTTWNAAVQNNYIHNLGGSTVWITNWGDDGLTINRSIAGGKTLDLKYNIYG